MGHLQTAVVNTEARLERLVQAGRESQRITPPYWTGYHGGLGPPNIHIHIRFLVILVGFGPEKAHFEARFGILAKNQAGG